MNSFDRFRARAVLNQLNHWQWAATDDNYGNTQQTWHLFNKSAEAQCTAILHAMKGLCVLTSGDQNTKLFDSEDIKDMELVSRIHEFVMKEWIPRFRG
jgi:hypothetical protein